MSKEKEIVSLIIYSNYRNPSQIPFEDMNEVAATVAGGNTAYAYYHSHRSERKGGALAPHIHLVVGVRENEFDHWINNCRAELARSNLASLWSLSGERNPQTKVTDLHKLMRYLLGNQRRNPPLAVYWSPDWFDFEKSATGCTHLDKQFYAA